MLTQVHEDLSLLRELANASTLSAGRIKLYAACFRRLLTEGGGQLKRAAALLKVPLVISSLDTEAVQTQAEWGNVVLYYIGTKERGRLGTFVMERPLPQGTRMPYDDSLRPVDLSLKEFLAQKILHIDGVFVSRYCLLVYVANKAGGVHLDSSPTDVLTKEIMAAIERMRGFLSVCKAVDGGNDLAIQTEYLLKKESPRSVLSGKSVDFVLLVFAAIGVLVSRSPSVDAIDKAIVEFLQN